MPDIKESKMFGVRFTKREREKFDQFLEGSSFATMAEFVREAMNTYMSHPEIQDPTTGDKSADQVIEQLTDFYERKESEERQFLKRFDRLEKKLDLLLLHLNITEKDLSEELIFDEEK